MLIASSACLRSALEASKLHGVETILQINNVSTLGSYPLLQARHGWLAAAEFFVRRGIAIIVTVLIHIVETSTFATTSPVPQFQLVILGIILRVVLVALLADPIASEVNIATSVKGDSGLLAC